MDELRGLRPGVLGQQYAAPDSNVGLGIQVAFGTMGLLFERPITPDVADMPGFNHADGDGDSEGSAFFTNPDEANEDGGYRPLTWTCLEYSSWAGHSWIDGEGLMFLYSQLSAMRSLAYFPSNCCNWLRIPISEPQPRHLEPELKLITPGGDESWLDGPNDQGRTPVIETKADMISEVEEEIWVEQVISPHLLHIPQQQIGLLTCCAWALFSNPSHAGQRRPGVPEIRITTPDGDCSGLTTLHLTQNRSPVTLTQQPSTSWADMDSDDEYLRALCISHRDEHSARHKVFG